MILTFFLLSLLVLFLDDWTGGWTTMHLFCVYRSSLKDPLFYIRLFGHVLGHAGWEHFLNNMLLLLVVGIVREWLSLGTVFGAPVGRWALLPLAKMPAGGFIVLGILCAIWRAAAAKRKEYLQKEARDTLTVHYQKEADREP